MTSFQFRLWAIADEAEGLSIRMDELSKRLRAQVRREDKKALSASKPKPRKRCPGDGQ